MKSTRLTDCSRRAFLTSSAFASVASAKVPETTRDGNLRPAYVQAYLDNCFSSKGHPMGVACHPLSFVGNMGIDVPFESGSAGTDGQFRVFHHFIVQSSSERKSYMSYTAAIHDYGNGVDCPGALHAQICRFNVFGQCPFAAWQTNLHRGQVRRIADAVEKLFHITKDRQAAIEKKLRQIPAGFGTIFMLEAFAKDKYQVYARIDNENKLEDELFGEIGDVMRQCSYNLPNGRQMPVDYTE